MILEELDKKENNGKFRLDKFLDSARIDKNDR